MSPALSGSQQYETEEWVYIVGGQDLNDKSTNVISKVKKTNPTVIEPAGHTKHPRVDPFIFKLGDKIVVMGGCLPPLIEVFNDKFEPQSGYEAKSEAFFHQLACYTSDMKLETCSYG